MESLLKSTAERAVSYLEGLSARPVRPGADAIARLSRLDVPLPDRPTDPAEVIAQLDEIGSPATVATAGSRYFGFVVGGSLPAALAANWLASTWDQNGAIVALSPIAAKLEEVAARWLLDALRLPATCGIGYVTCATQANFSGLAAARHALLARQGWDVEAQGLFGAPPITVVVGDEVHVSVIKALGMLGLGRERVIRVPVDDQGRMRADALPPLDANTIVCIQAGSVNTGAFDPAGAIIRQAKAAGAWVHVDGAFGLWAAAAPERAHLVRGIADADSWATDAHKWLNVPYDSGIVFVREPQHLWAAMAVNAAYLVHGDVREPTHYTPDFSRRARGVEVWAALHSLGRAGLADMIERTCVYASRFADGLRGAGYTVLNDVALNQVLVSFGDAETTRRVIAAIQDDGTCWCGGTVWQEQTAMRISVSSWATTGDDVDRSLEAMIRAAESVMQTA
ncbi:MAG TPA: aminotransferase class V-fold PLP-dependent enzyme [Aggregatilinea sp.]|uniref:pyridoxal phosphate-dependent decarboxylase family protein n=1 Tax=Aggregatilinea sp. TaxID=2806333 RepID=UPI002B5549A2|nr:aminotransferase class V-fold PLP-dependent enzyme [Aggregatilinea sp.]HML22293.1 aminotransferase class V-fold PLP-dependent enzyme [Aggregatilinea sp.]